MSEKEENKIEEEPIEVSLEELNSMMLASILEKLENIEKILLKDDV